ncbi:uncharacterized protein LOC131938143 isoform X2 [Physella acuta]|uniref:uncharacterized protein LOC131938143 isoform X1 n=1 Tax=Physella acuta TaxID=109671 RepID=UPI0027DD3902|nr:uncharacterized protein LOC131938143 isoform X1 [Physella acuta]XP_059152039.1 uncharacterized protein LOC131938143 isoform X2 [Physella acuta]
MSNINLFIVGRDGNGKTSTWKSILSQQGRVVPSHFINIEGNLNMNVGTGMFDGRLITAIDGKCIGDAEPDLPSIPSLKSAINKAIPRDGITAFVFVMKYGTRYTKQEKDAVERAKLLFGEYVFRKWGVLVFTHGDNFYLDHEDDKMDFNDWCEQQQGDIASLFAECGHRYVLFNNKSQDKQSMVKQLMENVNLLRAGPYFGEKPFPKIFPILLFISLFFIFDGFWCHFATSYVILVGVDNPFVGLVFGFTGCFLFVKLRNQRVGLDAPCTTFLIICIFRFLHITLYSLYSWYYEAGRKLVNMDASNYVNEEVENKST